MSKKLIPPEIPLSRWQELHEATMAFRQLEPWTWMLDSHLMCVIDSGGTPWFAAVLGAGKEVFGISLYRGETGLSLYSEAQNGLPAPLMAENLDALTLWFCAKNEMDAHDKKRYEALGYAPAKGTQQAWPKFLSHRPGFAPWHFEPFELDVMLAALRCITPFAAALRDNPRLWSGGFSDDCFEHETPVFDAGKASPDGHPREWRKWKSERLLQPQHAIVPAGETEQLIQELRQTPVAPDMHIEVGVLNMGVVEEPPRPYPAKVLLVAESKQGMIVYNHVLRQDENAAMAFLSALVDYINTSQHRPLSIKVADYQLANGISNVLDDLGIKLATVERLPVIENIRHMMTRGFR